MQFVLLVDALLLDAVPTLLLGDAQGAGDVVAEIQPLFFRQVVRCRKENVAARFRIRRGGGFYDLYERSLV